MRPVVYHIPVCPFSQRVEIQLELKGCRDEVDFFVVDITQPRPDWLLQKSRGTTALPMLDLGGGRVVKESLVLLQYFEDVFPERPVAQRDPYRRAVENMLTRMEGDFCNQGYGWVMNRELAKRDACYVAMLSQYEKLDAFLRHHSPTGPFLFDEFGWAETVFTPFFVRFWFLEYYENFQLPSDGRYVRVQRWIDACLAHPAAQQVCREEVVKLYHDYAQGAGNGALPPGRKVSSFTVTPHWRSRPWPPKNKYEHSATDAELGLL